MGDKNKEDENKNQLSQEDLIAKTVSGVLDGLKEQDGNADNPNDPPPKEVDPFDFTDLEQEVNNQNINPDINNQNNQNNQNNNDQNNQNDKPIHDPRVDAVMETVNANARDVEANGRITKMNNFIMEFNSEVKGVPELEIHRNEAINEAKKSIASGGYIPAGDMLSYLHGKDNINKLKNTEVNNNPQIGGGTDLNPNTDDKKFDLDAASADEIKEEYKGVLF